MRSLTLYFFILLINNLVFLKAQHVGDKKLYYGAAYYPEAWNFTTVSEDITYMKEMQVNVVRMAEFSWSLMEPTEGNFEFEWLHRIIDTLHTNGIDVILGTPTATPPAWLGEKHPDIYIVNEDNTRQTHGARRNCNYLNQTYIQKSQIIVGKLSKEFGNKTGVIGWQTDNEFGMHTDFSHETEKLWHTWLTNRYKTIDNLNNLWCTQLWSQTYNNFDQVPMVKSHVWHHPSLQFAWYRFWNDAIDAFQDVQLTAIRKYSSLPITHDAMPGQPVNYPQLFDNLDFVAGNNYHSFEAYNRIQSNYDRMRSYNKGNYWLFETAPNYSGGGKKGNTWFLHQPDGSLEAAMWMNYALGGQGLMFWLWRQHWAGQEMVHGSVLSSWGKPAANYQSLKNLGLLISEKSNLLMHTPVMDAETAIFWDHENLQGFRIEEYANSINYYTDWTNRFYRPLSDAFLHRDVTAQNTKLTNYKLIFMPLMPFISNELRNGLRQWVYEGGVLVFGPMSGYRTKEWTSFNESAIGNLEQWMNLEVESRIPVGTTIRPAEIPLMIELDAIHSETDVQCWLWSESLTSADGKIIAKYKNGMHSGKPAIIETHYGVGKIIYLGTDPGYDAYKSIALYAAKLAGVTPMATGDKDIVVVPRQGKNTNGIIIINLTNQSKQLSLNKEHTLIKKLDNFEPKEISLTPYEVKFIFDDREPE